MDACHSKTKVHRSPRWRADRVFELVDNPRSHLRRSDDAYIRSYRRYQIRRKAAGMDRTKRYGAFLAHPHSCFADAIYFGTNTDFRHILEAWLLTEEALAEIACRLKIEEGTINHYEALFFDIRDRPRDADWVQEVIVGRPEDLFSRRNGAMSDTQRGFLYRMFAYCGGPAVLDSVIVNIGATTMPASRESVGSWLDSAAEQVEQSLSAAAKPVRPIQDAVARFLELGLEPLRKAQTSKTARKGPPSDFEVFATAIIARLSGQSKSETGARRQRARTASNSRSLEPAVGSELTT